MKRGTEIGCAIFFTSLFWVLVIGMLVSLGQKESAIEDQQKGITILK